MRVSPSRGSGEDAKGRKKKICLKIYGRLISLNLSVGIREIRVLNIRGHHLGVGGQMVERLQGLAFGLVAVEGVAVGEEEITGLNDRMVAHGLVEDDVGEGHRGGLALHHHQGLARATEDDGIGALVLSVHLEGVLHRHPARRHPEVLHEEVQGLLAHLLLGRQDHPTAAQGVEDSHSPVTLFCFEPYQRGCSHYFAKISIIGLPALTDSWFFWKEGSQHTGLIKACVDSPALPGTPSRGGSAKRQQDEL